MIYPDQTTFKYPDDRLFPIQDVVPEHELACPQMRDTEGETCILLIKNGGTANTTIGRSAGIKLFVRDYLPDGTKQKLMEFVVLKYDKSAAFSDRGDSGAIIVDGQ